jgi:hypothetical protein
MSEQLDTAAFREALLNEQALTPSHRQRYEQEVLAMFQSKLTPRMRMLFVAGMVVCLAGAAMGAVFLVKLGRGQPALSAIWTAYTLTNLVMPVLFWRTLRRRTFDLRQGAWHYSKIGVAATVFIMLMIILHALHEPTNTSLVWCFFGAFCLVFQIAIELRNRIVQSDLTTREKLLRIEYQLMELSERVGGNAPRRAEDHS